MDKPKDSDSVFVYYPNQRWCNGCNLLSNLRRNLGKFLASSLAYEWPLIPIVDYSVRSISRIPEAARLSDLLGKKRRIPPKVRKDFLEDIWQVITALEILPVPLRQDGMNLIYWRIRPILTAPNSKRTNRAYSETTDSYISKYRVFNSRRWRSNYTHLVDHWDFTFLHRRWDCLREGAFACSS